MATAIAKLLKSHICIDEENSIHNAKGQKLPLQDVLYAYAVKLWGEQHTQWVFHQLNRNVLYIIFCIYKKKKKEAKEREKKEIETRNMLYSLFSCMLARNNGIEIRETILLFKGYWFSQGSSARQRSKQMRKVTEALLFSSVWSLEGSSFC